VTEQVSLHGGTEVASARISFARVEARSLSAPFDAALKGSLHPATAYARYTRTWRMGRWREDDGLILGRIGFESRGVTGRFHEEEGDFEPAALTEGATSPFVIDVASQRIAFQVRTGVIRPQTSPALFRRC